MALHTESWQCINRCNIFEVIGIPECCPYCTSSEVYPTDESLKLYESEDRQIIINEDNL